jgi:exosortase O
VPLVSGPAAAVEQRPGDQSVVTRLSALAPAILYALHVSSVSSWLRERWASQPDTAPLLLLLLGGSCWFLLRLRARGQLGFELAWLPGLGLLASLTLSLLNRLFWSIGTLEAVLALTGAYCLLGFYIPRGTWRRGSIVLVLLCLSLPVQDHYQDLAGFPFRLLTARIVAELMSSLGVPSLSQTSLVLSAGSVTAVDYPCSGLRFLHAGTVFLAALLLVGHAPRRRAALCALGFLSSLVVLNVWRVFSLVYLADVLQLRDEAEGIHSALGVAGFTACCGALLFALRPLAGGAPSAPLAPAASTVRPTRSRAVLVVSVAIACSLGLDALAGTSRTSPTVAAPAAPFLDLPGFALQPLPLDEQERDYYARRGVARAGKFALVGDAQRPGSTLLVTVAADWYVQHAPERCVRGSGHVITRSDLLQVPGSADDPRSGQPMLVRRLVLDGGRSSLLYWFTDGHEVVADYGARIWRGLGGAPRPWALVQIMAPGGREPASPRVSDHVLQRAVQQMLLGGGDKHGD